MPKFLDKIAEFFAEYGWEYERLNGNTILSGFAGETSTFTLFVHVCDDWVIMSISPLVERPVDSCRANILGYLARLNFHATLVKFSMDDQDNVSLTVELPVRGLTFESFASILETLCFYADDQYQRILELATDPNAVLPSIAAMSSH
jgi:hypothetical protein